MSVIDKKHFILFFFNFLRFTLSHTDQRIGVEIARIRIHARIERQMVERS